MFATKTRQSYRPCEGSVKPRLATLLLAGFGVLTLFVQPAAATLQEVHEFDFLMQNPVPGTTYEYSFEMPLFDTQGGARTLISFHMDYLLYSNYRYDINANQDSRYHACEVSWQQNWTSTRNGATWFPLDTGYLDARNGVGEISAPYTPGLTGFQVLGAGIGHSENQGPPDLLASMTGTGTATIHCTDVLSTMSIGMPDLHHLPPGVQVVFDPNLLTVMLDGIGMNVTLTYYYPPEPASLSLLGLLALLLRRR
jgi:hypothetical protein